MTSSTNESTLLTQSPESAAKIIRNGGIVIFPTETVYGMGASSLNFESCLKIYKIKNRPPDNPLISHFYSIQDVERYAHLNNQSRLLMEKHSPGPITLILRKKEKGIFTTGLPTIAVRIPSHPTIRKLLEIAQIPISAPSANLSGKPSITREIDAIETFQGLVDCILLESVEVRIPTVGLESTVVDMTTDQPKILRPGSIELDEIQETLGVPVDVPEKPEFLSPGIKYKHYSPDGKLRLFRNPKEVMGRIQENIQKSIKTAVLYYAADGSSDWDEFMENKTNSEIFNLSVGTNLDYARQLYSFFVDSDKLGVEEIFCEYPRQGYLFSAINNRLKKASGN